MSATRRCDIAGLQFAMDGRKADTKKPPDWEAFLFNGADTQNRTGDLILTKDALYRLSHISTLTGKDHAQCVI